MVTLARSITAAQLEEMRVNSTDLDRWDKDHVPTQIDLLVKLSQRHTSSSAFLAKLQQLLENASDASQVSEKVRAFRERHPHIDSESESRAQFNGVSSRGQCRRLAKAFNDALLKMSRKVSTTDFEIIRGICPLPQGTKSEQSGPHQLFHALKTLGRIGPCDTELLRDIFTVMELAEPLQVLTEYEEFLNQDPRPSAPMAPNTTSPISYSYPPQQSAYHHNNPYLPPSPAAPQNGSYCSQQSPLSAGWPAQPPVGAVPEPSPLDLRSRPPGYTDHTYPRPLHSTQSQGVSHPQVFPHTPCQGGGGDQAAAPPGLGHTSTLRSGEPLDSDLQRPLPFNPTAHHNFQSQVSFPSSPFLPPQPEHSFLGQSAGNHSRGNPTNDLHPNPPPALPVTSNASPAPSANSDHTHSFPEAVSCRSLGNRNSLPPQIHRPPAATLGPPRDLLTSGPSSASAAYSLPPVPPGNGRLLTRHSREINSLPQSELSRSRHARSEAVPRPSPQRSVFTRGDIRAGVGSGCAGDHSSINASIMSDRENEVNSATATQALPLDHHAYPPPPTSPHPTQHSVLVPGASFSAISGPGHPNPHNSQFVSPKSSYDCSLFPPHSSGGGSVLAASHDPSTLSLVERQRLRGSVGPSNSFSAIPEDVCGEEGEEAGRCDKSSESELTSESGQRRKRVRETDGESSTASSSSEDEEEMSSSKRARTEQKSNRSMLGTILNLFSWGGTKKPAESDSDSEDCEDAQQQ